MPFGPRIYAVASDVGDGIEIHLRTLTVSEFITALRLGGDDDGAKTALRMSLLNVAGTAVDYATLKGGGLSKHLPRTAHLVRAQQVWQKLHDIDSRYHLVEQALHTLERRDGDTWAFTLPETRIGRDGPAREVVMAEVDHLTVGEAVQQAVKGARSSQARLMLATRGQVERSIRSVADGETTYDFPQGMTHDELDEHLSVFDLQVCGAVWAKLHASLGEVGAGNLKPVALPSS